MENPLRFEFLLFVDADHAGDLVTRRSRTGFIVFLNNAPIYWSSKKQNSVETSTFGSEFVAMKQATEYLSLLCRRHVADMSPTSPNVAKSWPT